VHTGHGGVQPNLAPPQLSGHFDTLKVVIDLCAQGMGAGGGGIAARGLILGLEHFMGDIECRHNGDALEAHNFARRAYVAHSCIELAR
jgi:hypothetical protein